MGIFQYHGDDLTTYKIAVDPLVATPGAGNLSPATGTEVEFPAFWIPRHLLCAQLGVTNGPAVRVPCNNTHPAYINPFNTTLSIGGHPYSVMDAIGELRQP